MAKQKFERNKPHVNIGTHFVLTEKQDVVLDFREDAEHIGSCKINGKTLRPTIANEHIIFPAAATKKGKNTITINFVCGNQSLNHRDKRLRYCSQNSHLLIFESERKFLFPFLTKLHLFCQNLVLCDQNVAFQE